MENYEEAFEKKRSNHEQFDDATGPIMGIIIHEKLFNNFMLLIILKNILKKLPLTCYDIYTELDIV